VRACSAQAMQVWLLRLTASGFRVLEQVSAFMRDRIGFANLAPIILLVSLHSQPTLIAREELPHLAPGIKVEG
jgi:hypothetical protein